MNPQKPDNLTEEEFEKQKEEVVEQLKLQFQYCFDIGGNEFLEFYKSLPNCNVQGFAGMAWAKLVMEFQIQEIPARPISRLIDRSFINGVYHGWVNGKKQG